MWLCVSYWGGREGGREGRGGEGRGGGRVAGGLVVEGGGKVQQNNVTHDIFLSIAPFVRSMSDQNVTATRIHHWEGSGQKGRITNWHEVL